jgi:hypothetical protein
LAQAAERAQDCGSGLEAAAVQVEQSHGELPESTFYKVKEECPHTHTHT